MWSLIVRLRFPRGPGVGGVDTPTDTPTSPTTYRVLVTSCDPVWVKDLLYFDPFLNLVSYYSGV